MIFMKVLLGDLEFLYSGAQKFLFVDGAVHLSSSEAKKKKKKIETCQWEPDPYGP